MLLEDSFMSIPNYSGYRINNCGDMVTYYKRIKVAGRAGTITIILDRPHKLLNPYLDKDGYKAVYLKRDDGMKMRQMIHQLVLIAHGILKPFDGAVVRHLDGNRLNNHIYNLRWGTPRENSDDTIMHGSLAGVNNAAAKVSEEDVRYIRTSSLPTTELMKAFSLSRSSINCIRRKATYKNVI